MRNLPGLIKESFEKFNINLTGKTVLTEAATGNYVCTPVLAAMAGAKVYAIAKNSKYGSVDQICKELFLIANFLNIDKQISIITGLDDIILSEIDVVTNTGFVRPIDKVLINKLKPDSVIPLMWEPWEFRPSDIDLDAAISRGIKVYGTNEANPRLQTMQYIGLTVLYFLLKEKRSSFSSKVLVIGCEKFNTAINFVLTKLNYSINSFLTNEYQDVELKEYNTIVVAEWNNPRRIIGKSTDSLINSNSLTEEHLVIHISGNVDFTGIKCLHYPDKPAPLGYMSYTTDFIDPIAVIDLHAAGLKVAEGMLLAKSMDLKNKSFKKILENNFPGLAFSDEKYW